MVTNHGKNGQLVTVAVGFILLLALTFAESVSAVRTLALLGLLLGIVAIGWYAGRAPAVTLAAGWAATRLGLAWANSNTLPAANGTSNYWHFLSELVFFVVLIWLLLKMERQSADDRELADTDALTGVKNRRSFEQFAGQQLAMARRYRQNIAVAYIDIDDFKGINDRLGHAAGDEMLRLVAYTLATNVREVDIVARMGGDEFAILFPQTDADGIQVALERLRDKLMTAAQERDRPATFSVGGVAYTKAPLTLAQMLERADAAMYESKQAGKDRIAVVGR